MSLFIIFIILLLGDKRTLDNEEDIESLIVDISDELSKYSDEIMQKLTFSYGYQYYSEALSLDDLYTKADKKMYENKKTMKE